MPDRILGSNPARRAGYIMIAFALIAIVLAVWNVSLSRRVGEQESTRKAERRAAAARQQLGCVIFTTIVEVAVEIPLRNLNDILAGGTLNAEERADREMARGRYLAARERLRPAIAACTRK